MGQCLRGQETGCNPSCRQARRVFYLNSRFIGNSTQAMRLTYVLACWLTVWVIVAAAWADEKKSSTVFELETMVVTADALDENFQTGDVAVEEISSFVTVIDRSEFEGRYDNLADVVEQEAGVQVRQTGGPGSFASISLRGSSSDQVMVYLDGVLLNDASGGGVDLSNINLGDVAAIEIYRGATPVNFSQASIGGAVNIKTRRAGKGLQGSATVGAGSFESYRGAAFVSHQLESWDYLLSADYFQTQNNFEFLYDNRTKWTTADDRIETRNNAQVYQGNALGRLGHELSPTARLDFTGQWFSKNQGIPSWNNSPLTTASLDTQRGMGTLQLIADDLTPLSLNTRLRLNYSDKQEEYDDSYGSIGLGKQHSIYKTKRYDADYFFEYLRPSNSFSCNTAIEYQTYLPDDLTGKTISRESRRHQVSLAAQDSLFLFDEQVTVNPALRFTWLRDELESAVSKYQGALPGQSREETDWSPQLGLSYRPLNWLTIKGNAGRYVRHPSFFELFGDRGLVVGNMDLKSENGINYDGGLQGLWQFSTPWLSRLSLSGSYFYSDINDLITQVYDARGIGKSVNVSGARISGLESSLQIDGLHFLRLIVNATWQDPQNDSQIDAFNGKQLPGRFETAYLGRLEAQMAGFKLYLETVVEQNMYYDTANLLPAADKEEYNTGISWNKAGWQIAFNIKNLGDAQYEDFNGYPLPGRAYDVSAQYRF